MPDLQHIEVRVPLGMLPPRKLSAINPGDSRFPFGHGPRSACEVVLAAPALTTSPRCANRADRRRVAQATRRLGVPAAP